MNFDVKKLQWTRKPKSFAISQERIEIVTKPHTDLWQRTYYHFRNDNAPVLQMSLEEQFFSFCLLYTSNCGGKTDGKSSFSSI